ncbi:hypothetical protein QYF61_018860 [Mycteria americana]|uniref:Uncharacterized protein n=1 Tax=Mycteria americana TaxID=33587 RepID=A0AAN7PK60_MYCAM|nr:hypothetical protein QYF61_018860 [Mycteria americana]
MLCSDIVQSLSLGILKTCLDKVLSSLLFMVHIVGCRKDCQLPGAECQETRGIPTGLASHGPLHGPQPGSRAGQEGSQGQPQTPSGTSVGMGKSAFGLGPAQQGQGPAVVELGSDTPTASLGQGLADLG